MTSPGALQALNDELSRTGCRLCFRPSLEAAYERDTAETRFRFVRRFLLTYVCANLLCLPCDFEAGSRSFHLGLLFRVSLFAPLVLLVLAVLRRPVSARTKACSAVLPLLFGTGFVTLLARATPQPFTDRYLLGATVGIMAQTLLVPVPFAAAALALACATVLLGALSLLPLGPAFFPPVTPDLVFFVAGVGACFLYQRFQSERGTRRDYLLREANRLHMEQVLATNAHLERLSSIDSLTGVFNRRCLDAALARLWRVAEQNERWIAVLMVDIDHFKRVNDTHGHQHGDFCLEQVAQILQRSVRAGVDTLARYGGEEFVAILPDADQDVAEEIASRVRRCTEELGLSAFHHCVVTVSIGVAAVKGGEGDLGLQDFLAAADAALYEAKKAGRNRVVAAGAGAAAGSLTMA